MGLQQQAVCLIAAAQVDKHAALDGASGVIAQSLKCILHPYRRLFREAGGAVDGQQLRC